MQKVIIAGIRPSYGKVLKCAGAYHFYAEKFAIVNGNVMGTL